jgi:hypothetical protein
MEMVEPKARDPVGEAREEDGSGLITDEVKPASLKQEASVTRQHATEHAEASGNTRRGGSEWDLTVPKSHTPGQCNAGYSGARRGGEIGDTRPT